MVALKEEAKRIHLSIRGRLVTLCFDLTFFRGDYQGRAVLYGRLCYRIRTDFYLITVRHHNMQLSNTTRRFFQLAWAVTKGFFGPVALALCIVAYGALAPWQPPKELKDALSTFFAVLFFIMFFFGQYKRVGKQTDDKDSFKAVSEQLESLQDLVRKIRITHTSTTPVRVAVSD